MKMIAIRVYEGHGDNKRWIDTFTAIDFEGVIRILAQYDDAHYTLIIKTI